MRELPKQLNLSLQAKTRTREGANCPDRDAKFGHIGASVKSDWAENQPVISVDTKKKELVGDFKNNGREWRPKGDPEEARVHDFLIKELGRAVPYGVYDRRRIPAGSVGIDHAGFYVELQESSALVARESTSGGNRDATVTDADGGGGTARGAYGNVL